MPKYIVRINERYERYMKIEAKDINDAVEFASQGEGEEMYHGYVENMSIDADEVELLDEEETIFGDEGNHDPQE